MGNIHQDAPVCYPQKENATGFFPDEGIPFQSALIGITYPYPEYALTVRHELTTVLEYVLEGEGELLIDGVWQRVRPSDAYILRPQERLSYRARPENPWKKVWINYRASYLPPLLDAYRIKTGIYRFAEAHELFERLFSLSHKRDASPETCLAIASAVHSIVEKIATASLVAPSDEYRIKEALHARVYERLSLDELASALHLSKSGLIRHFKKHYGVTPYDYLLSLKIEAAKLLLKNTRMTVREIADKLAISDEHYFSTLFLSRVGVRPAEYRARKRL